MEKLILPIFIFMPLLMSLILMSPVFKDDEKIIRRTAKGFSLIYFIFNALFISIYNFSSNGINYNTELKIFGFNWLESLGIKASFAVDNLSLLLITLTSFIFLIAIFYSKHTIKKSYQLYYSLILFLQTAVNGIFLSTDMFCFFFFWELELIPMYLLLLKWSSGNKQKTAFKFLIYTFVGSIFILLGLLILYAYNYSLTGMLNANILDVDINVMSKNMQNVVFFLFLIGFGVKLPIIPLHNWLPDTHSQAPSPVSIILSSILLKIGAYGILKFNFGIFQEIFKEYIYIIVILACVNIIYAGLCAIVQKDIKRIIAYSGISHMGIFLLGLCAFNAIGFVGAVFQLFSHALISAGLFAITGLIYIKCGTKNILRIQGLASKMPKLFYLSIPIVLAGIGIPLTSGFIAEFLTFVGILSSDLDNLTVKIFATISVLTLIITSIYLLKIFHSVFYGELLEKYKKVKDIDNNNFYILCVIILYILFLGVFPSIITNLLVDYSLVVDGFGG